MREAYFAGGCFWCVTPIYKMYGVDKVICGYAGGDEEKPTYEQVKHQQTGHRETIKLLKKSSLSREGKSKNTARVEPSPVQSALLYLILSKNFI
jgi:hypothetical protein